MCLDDAMEIGKKFSEHLTNLRKVFERYCMSNLKLNLEKCYLAGSEVLYLGYVVFRDGILVDPAKINALDKFSQLIDVKPLQSFLGLTSYYRRFVETFSSVASLL